MEPNLNELLWFNLVDSDGKPFKNIPVSSVLRSEIAVPVVDQLKGAVQAKFHEDLTGIASPLLVVYKNMEVYKASKIIINSNNVAATKAEPMDAADNLDGVGLNSKEAAMIIEVPSKDLRKKLVELGVKFATRDLAYLRNQEPDEFKVLQHDWSLTKKLAQNIINQAKSKVKSRTRLATSTKYSIYIDGPLGGNPSGQNKSYLCYAYTSSGGVYAAKIYHEHEADYKREVFISSMMEHENLIKFINSFELGNNRYAIIMPLYPRCATDLMSDHAKDGIPFETLQTIARDCFSALKYMHARGYCFMDLKPSNIMMHYGDPGRAILIDYGGVVPKGEPLIEITEHYCLDIDKMVAHEGIDWVCLGSSLAELAGIDISAGTRKDVAYLVEQHEKMGNKLKRFINSCFFDHFWKPIEEVLAEMLGTVEIS